MPRLALTYRPGAAPEDLRRLTSRWIELLDRSVRPVEVSRTVLPDLAAVNVLLGFFPNLPQPAVSADGTIYAWLDGEVWDRVAARAAAGLPAGGTESDAELCLQLYLRCGDPFCERLNGQFVIAIYDSVRKRVLLANDRHAFRPVFWREEAGGFICANEIKAVLAASERKPEVDPAGVLEFFAFGYEFADRTLFRGVQTLLPGSRLVFQDGRARVERYWRYRYPERVSRASEADLAEEFAGRMRIACSRQTAGPGRAGMALSAGLDSRIVAAALPPQPEPYFAYTTGYEDSLEALGARLLADTYGMRHAHLIPGQGYLSRIAPGVVWRTEGAFALIHSTSLQFHDRLRPELDIILTGHSGGALSGQSLLPVFPNDEARKDLPGYLVRRMPAMPAPAVQALMAPRAWQEQWEPVIERLRGACRELAREQRRVGDAAIAFNMERRQARFINHSGQVDRDDFEVRAPLLDNDVVDFWLTVPYKYRFAQRLYKRTLAEKFPEAACLPWSKTGGPVPGTPLAILANFYALGARHLLEKRFPSLARKKKDRVRSERVIGEELRTDSRLRREVLDPFLRGDSFPDDVLNRRRAAEVAAEHWSGAANHYHEVAGLVTLALVYRHFVERGLRAPETEQAPALARAG